MPGKPKRALNRRTATAVAVVTIVVIVIGWFWLRNSSLVAVEQVKIIGLNGYYDRAARRAVAAAAREMTTLNVDEGELRDVAGQFVTVVGLRADADFPHKLTIYVDQRKAVAAVRFGGRLVAVDGGGRVVESAVAARTLPTLGTKPQIINGGINDSKSKQLLTVLQAAPDLLLRRSENAKWGSKGIVVELRDGPDLIFGTTEDVAAKWRAAAAVLADPGTKGARYVDLRIADRPAVGGVGAAPTKVVTPEPSAATGASGQTGGQTPGGTQPDDGRVPTGGSTGATGTAP